MTKATNKKIYKWLCMLANVRFERKKNKNGSVNDTQRRAVRNEQEKKREEKRRKEKNNWYKFTYWKSPATVYSVPRWRISSFFSRTHLVPRHRGECIAASKSLTKWHFSFFGFFAFSLSLCFCVPRSLTFQLQISAPFEIDSRQRARVRIISIPIYRTNVVLFFPIFSLSLSVASNLFTLFSTQPIRCARYVIAPQNEFEGQMKNKKHLGIATMWKVTPAEHKTIEKK